MIDRLRAAAGTVRVRTTAAAVLMVAVVLLLGAAGLVVALRAVLTDEVEAAAALHASRAARLLESGADPASVVNTAEDEVFIQILRKHDTQDEMDPGCGSQGRGSGAPSAPARPSPQAATAISPSPAPRMSRQARRP